MDRINHHHLLYFQTVAREDTGARASQQLRLAQPTLSGQIRALEDALGEKLFMRSGRNLALTDVGQTAYRCASEIFSLGREMMDALRGRPAGRSVCWRSWCNTAWT
jgi:LysR family transcriptional activator of nhaA